MTTTIDTRPVHAGRWIGPPGQVRTVTHDGFPAGYLDDRAFEYQVVRAGFDTVLSIEVEVGATSISAPVLMPRVPGLYHLLLVDITDEDRPEARTSLALRSDGAAAPHAQGVIEIPVEVTDGELTIALDVTLVEVVGGGGGGTVESVVEGPGISVDATDPANPVVAAEVTQVELDNEATARGNADAALAAAVGALEALDPIEVGDHAGGVLAGYYPDPEGFAENALSLLDAYSTGQTDAAIAAAVTSALNGADWKASARVVATTNIVSLLGTQTIDGEALSVGDRVLATAQTAGQQNGLYVVAVGPWGRAPDADTSAEVTSGMTVPITAGSAANTDSLWMLTTNDPIVLGTTALTFTKWSPLNATLNALAALTGAADRLPYFTGAGTAALTVLSSFMRTLLDDGNQATAQGTLGVYGTAAVDALVSVVADDLAALEAALPGTYVPSTRTVSAGAGLTGGGDLSADRTLTAAVFGIWTDLGNLGATETISGAASILVRREGTLDQACTITIDLADDQQIDLYLHQDGTGGRAVTFSGVDSWVTAVPATAGRAASVVDRFKFEQVDGVTFGYWVTEPRGVLAESHAPTTVVNSVAETTLKTLTLPAGLAATAGRLVRFVVLGDIFNNSGGAVTFLFRFKLGGTTITESTAMSLNAAGTRRTWRIEVRALVSASNAQILDVEFASASVAGTATTWPVMVTSQYLERTKLGAADFTANTAFLVSVQMGTADLLADVVAQAAWLELV